MTKAELSELRNYVFLTMLREGTLRNQNKMVAQLKGVYMVLNSHKNLSERECDDFLFSFFKEYEKGCNSQIPESYIRNYMIPVVKNCTTMDIAWGASAVLTTEMR